MFLKTQDVAMLMRLSKMTITNFVKSGLLKPVNTDPRFFMFLRSDVDALIKKREEASNE